MNLIYKCKNCSETFNNKGELYNHQKEIHNIVNNAGKQQKYNLTCKFCGINKFICKSGMTLHEKHCDKNPNKIPYRKYTMSEEGKKHISEGMKKAAKEGRNRGWTTTKCGPQNKSYPEKFFTEVIENEFEHLVFKRKS